MDLDNPALLLSGMLFGSIGMGFLVVGRKQARFDCLAMGIALSVAPILAHSALALWGIAAACFGGFYARRWFG